MKDYKNEILNSIERNLIKTFNKEEVELISKIIMETLYNYDITEKENGENNTTSNEELLNLYGFCLRVEGKSEKTISQYTRACNKLSEFIQKPFQEITTYDIRYFLSNEKSRGISNCSLENLRSYISSFFTWMYNEKITEENVMSTVKPIKITKDIKKSFSDVEIDMLRSGCRNEKDRALIEVLLSSGVRVEELSEMKIIDVNMETLTVYVKHGKGDKERITYISPVARQHLNSYLMSRQDNVPYLFINKDRKKLAPGGIRYILNQISKNSGVEDVHPHRFRRTFATHLAAKGMDIQAIQKLLGHSGINTTLKYVFTNDEQVKALYNKYIT